MELASLADIFGDLVIYRDLNAVDERLPRYADIWHEIGMSGPIPPRKLDMAYARSLERLLVRAQEVISPAVPQPASGPDRPSRPAGRPPLREIVYVGDNMLSDGGAFKNLRELTGWPGWCFIGVEKDERFQLVEHDGVCQANRWLALAEFLRRAQREGAAIDAGTAVIVDIDKTAIGARGRNDKAIDRARVAAMEATLRDAIGPGFNYDECRRAYALVNTPRYHPFAADNQDNVAYICLMVSAGLFEIEALLAAIDGGQMTSFRELMDQVDAQVDELPAPVRRLHQEIHRRTLAGDLTPFKAFRRREYQETVDRMGHLPDDAHLAQRLVEEICMTREVLDACAWLKARDCLMMALSDKPDEATAPTSELAAQGYLPLHRARTHIVGQTLDL